MGYHDSSQKYEAWGNYLALNYFAFENSLVNSTMCKIPLTIFAL
jgi:hypothetical protein